MTYNKELIAGKLRRWEQYLDDYRLPAWGEIPDEYFADTLKNAFFVVEEEKFGSEYIDARLFGHITQTVMPGQFVTYNGKYYRVHIAYLIMVCTLKQSLSIPTLQTMIPLGLSEAELKRVYSAFVVRHRMACQYFLREVRVAAGGILGHGPEELSELSTDDTGDLITTVAVISGFARLMAEKLLLLEGKDLSNGGSIELHHAPEQE